MTKRSLQVLIALSLLSAGSFAAQERVVRFQNHVRLGYDDNIYQTEDKQGSAYITDVFNLTAKLNFSTRTDALLYWEPKFEYRFDADPNFVSYQNLYARLNHAISQRLFLTLSDHFLYQQKEAQAGADVYNSNYYENNLLGALDYTLSDVSYLKLGAGYGFRIWDDSSYGEWQAPTTGNPLGSGGNNYNKIAVDGAYYRQMKPNKTLAMGAVDYESLAYDGDRGGYNSVSLLVGADQNFTPNVTGFGRVGVSFNQIENINNDQDSTTPYLQAGLETSPSARTTVTSSLGYSLARSENSAYNAQNRFNIGLGASHDITAKITLTGSFDYIYSFYDSAYVVNGNTAAPDGKDQYLALGARLAYQINRNNFLDLGYLFRTRMASGGAALGEWDGNRVDIAWRLRL
jgi:hypothetical protein